MLRFTLNPGNKLFPKDLNAYHMQKQKEKKKGKTIIIIK